MKTVMSATRGRAGVKFERAQPVPARAAPSSLRSMATLSHALRPHPAADAPVRVARCEASRRPAAFVLLNPDSEVEELENGRVRTKVFVDLLMIQKAYETCLDYYRSQVEVPGFRKGSKAPEGHIIQAVGKDVYYLAVLEEVLKLTLKPAFDRLGENILADSEQVETPSPELVEKIKTRQPFRYAVIADRMPELRWKVPYSDMKVQIDLSGLKQTDEEKVQESIDEFLKERAAMKIVFNRGIKESDLCIVEAKCFREDTGEQALNLPDTPFNLDTEQEPLPGFNAKIEGMQIGDEREFGLVLPQEWPEESMRGVAVQFQVKVNEIFERELPEMTDELAQQMIPGVEGLAQAKQMLAEQAAQEKQQAKVTAFQNALTEKIAEILDCEVPESMVEEIGRQNYGKQLMQLQTQGGLAPDMVKKLASEKIVRDYIEKERDTLEMLSRASIGIAEIQRLEGLTLTEEQLQAQVDAAKASFGDKAKDADEEKLKSMIKEQVEVKNVFEWLQKNANVEYV